MKNKNLLVGALAIATIIGVGAYAMSQSSSEDLQGAFPGIESSTPIVITSTSPARSSCDELVMEVDGDTGAVTTGSIGLAQDAVLDGCQLRVVAHLTDADQTMGFNCTETHLGTSGSGQEYFDCVGGNYNSYDGSTQMSKSFEYLIQTDGSTDIDFKDIEHDASGGATSSWTDAGRIYSVFAY
jgi:hypothetical protein